MPLTWCYSEIEGKAAIEVVPTATEQLSGGVVRSVRFRKLFEMLRSQVLMLRTLRAEELETRVRGCEIVEAQRRKRDPMQQRCGRRVEEE